MTEKASPFPPPPSSDIDWPNVGFQVREGVSMILDQHLLENSSLIYSELSH